MGGGGAPQGLGHLPACPGEERHTLNSVTQKSCLLQKLVA
jgi:hypothetical protein